MTNFCRVAKELMSENHMTQKELSKITGISESSISRYLNGQLIPRVDVINSFAKTFNVDPSLFFEKTDKNSFSELKTIITRNRENLTPQEKAELISILFGDKK